MHRFIFLGPPGVGKGTQAQRLSTYLKIPHISTGDILRSIVTSDSPLAETVKGYLDRGALIPDELMTHILVERLREPDTKNGFILDGYPRTLPQAEALKKEKVGIDKVLYFTAPEKTIMKRLLGRLTCPSCKDVFNEYIDGVEEGVLCPRGCGGRLSRRGDDTEEIVRERLYNYKEQTAPLVEHYRHLSLLVEIDSTKPPDEVFEQVLKATE